jgi:hypothetical protein
MRDLAEAPKWIIDLARTAASAQLSPSVHDTAAFNMERVRGYYETHLGCSRKEAARDLGLSWTQVQHAVGKLRAEWRNRGK